jgi:hypothetical protein
MFAFYHPYLDVLNGGAPHRRPNLPQSRLRPWTRMGPGRAVFFLTSTLPARSVIGRSCIGHFPWQGRPPASTRLKRSADLLVGHGGAGCLRGLRPHRIEMKGLGRHRRAPLDR